MEYSALYSCNFCKSNPVNRSSLILPVPKRQLLCANGVSGYYERCGQCHTFEAVAKVTFCADVYIFAASGESLETRECVNVVETDLLATKG